VNSGLTLVKIRDMRYAWLGLCLAALLPAIYNSDNETGPGLFENIKLYIFLERRDYNWIKS
jgi:hypothetical protein